jgi:hypothetical protein
MTLPAMDDDHLLRGDINGVSHDAHGRLLGLAHKGALFARLLQG